MAPSPMDGQHNERSEGTHLTTWYWMRAYYFEKCKDDLILDAVWPTIESCCAHEKAQGYFQRKSTGGPNILIGLKTGWIEAVTNATGLISRYFEAHPSRTEISAAEFSQLHHALADWEWRTGKPAMPLQKNNTVVVGNTEPDNPLSIQGELLETLRTFMCRSSAIVVRWLYLVREKTWERQHIALKAMIALAWVANPESLASCASFGSHAAGFLRKADRDHKLRDAFAERYTSREGPAIRNLLQSSVAELQQGRSELPGMDDYITLLRQTMDDVYHGLLDGRYQTYPALQFEYPEQYRSLISLLDESPSLRAWQTTVNLVYLMLNQLGLAPLERFFACYLLSRASEDAYDYQIHKIAAQLAETRDSSTMLPFFTGWERERSVNVNFCHPVAKR